MNIKQTFLGVAVAAFAGLGGSASHAAVLVYDFENSNVSAGNYSYASDTNPYSLPAGSIVSVPGATFSGTSGVQNNAPAWGFPAAPAPGTNAAFLQSYPSLSLGVIQLNASALVAGQLYTLSFDSVARPGYGADPFTVTYNGNVLGTYTPGAGWSTYTVSFTGAANQDLIFSATRIDGDHASGLDNVTVAAVPEPTTWAMMIVGFLGLGFMAYRRRPAGRIRVA